MIIANIIETFEQFAPPSFQESYDNCGLLTGNALWECKGILCTLDATEDVVLEAIAKGCNMVVAHHPIIFDGLKKITGKNYIEKTVIAAIKNDVAIYAIHTNLDSVLNGVNGKIADTLGLINRQILLPKQNLLMKLFTYVPLANVKEVREAIFKAGGGHIGNYSECSFSMEGTGTFKGESGTNPFVGEVGKRHEEREIKLEIVFPTYLKNRIVAALQAVHPYEEVAYDIVNLNNTLLSTGSGLVGELPEPIDEIEFLQKIKAAFGLKVIKHTALLGKQVKKVAVCGGAGSFLISNAKAAGADFYITSDVKYHEFFDAENKLVVADIGHWESEQFTPDLLISLLQAKFPTFAVLKSGVDTNPVKYFL
ncbi:MAG: Nif3-like dinuclear metal center hexameric protein [Pedobacter sp.]|nr:Nif3-like dinuclear metal center hexameric protein [Chitinophagaceae bacterium]